MWPQPGQPRMPMDEHLFLQPAPETAGRVLPEFCLGVVRVQEVKEKSAIVMQLVCMYVCQLCSCKTPLLILVAQVWPSLSKHCYNLIC